MAERAWVGDVEPAFDVTGEGPAVLLLHGMGSTRRMWRHIVPELARDHRVIAPDLRGFGSSTRTAEGYDKTSMSGDLVGLLRELEVTDAAVVAHDVGGPVAFALAPPITRH